VLNGDFTGSRLDCDLNSTYENEYNIDPKISQQVQVAKNNGFIDAISWYSNDFTKL